MDKDVDIGMKELAKHRPVKKRSGRIASEASPFLGISQVLELVPIRKTTLYLMIGDGIFPAPKKLGPRTSVWSKEEVNAWIAEKMK